MRVSFSRLGNSLPFSGLFRAADKLADLAWNWLGDEKSTKRFSFDLHLQAIGSLDLVVRRRQLEQEMETVVKVLQPGPLGIIEHKFSAEEIHNAHSTVKTAVENWRRNASTEQRSTVLKDYVSH
ncbi:hypothetical protein RJ639_000437 [Escallonia herrerae]|uniref:Uncharacterized protein n=1 Tax=Escallonia herrerae TaxID=1293975 RepID=A0AA89BGI2_9ASTE|nr:hypothetical protein RJ639_000437 [Escallonia herrerae]